MDKRLTHPSAGTVDTYPAASAGMRNRAERPLRDGSGTDDPGDMSQVLQAIAARIDTLLDENGAVAAEAEAGHRAAQVGPSERGPRDTDAASDLRRHELATTVLRISADGRLDVDDRTPEVSDEAEKPTAAPVVVAGDEAPETTAPAAMERSDVDDRLRAVRERLAKRSSSTNTARVDVPTASAIRAPIPSAPIPSAPASRVPRPRWRLTEVRPLLQKVLIGLAIAGVSALVSLLIA